MSGSSALVASTLPLRRRDAGRDGRLRLRGALSAVSASVAGTGSRMVEATASGGSSALAPACCATTGEAGSSDPAAGRSSGSNSNASSDWATVRSCGLAVRRTRRLVCGGATVSLDSISSTLSTLATAPCSVLATEFRCPIAGVVSRSLWAACAKASASAREPGASSASVWATACLRRAGSGVRDDSQDRPRESGQGEPAMWRRGDGSWRGFSAAHHVDQLAAIHADVEVFWSHRRTPPVITRVS